MPHSHAKTALHMHNSAGFLQRLSPPKPNARRLSPFWQAIHQNSMLQMTKKILLLVNLDFEASIESSIHAPTHARRLLILEAEPACEKRGVLLWPWANSLAGICPKKFTQNKRNQNSMLGDRVMFEILGDTDNFSMWFFGGKLLRSGARARTTRLPTKINILQDYKSISNIHNFI
jgi:hypothetical protein